MERLLDALAILSLALLVIVLRSLRREHIRVEHSVSWLAASVALLALSRSRALLERFSAWLGLHDASVALIAIILVVFLGVFYRYSRIVSGLKDMNITLTQRVAILEHKLQRQHEEAQDKP
ncbi:MAG: DUF2304 domain-containing protein [Candidatus Solibacter usitatus]|nr:DUF2304 domain-containing protein [Candidatus Solibacter usitatus]